MLSLKEEASNLIEVRALLPNDENFISATWCRGFFYGNPALSTFVEEKQFLAKYSRVIAYILAKPAVTVRLMCLKEDSDIICAYAVLESQPKGKVLHWAYCKPAFRRFGLTKDLMPLDIMAVTHMTEMANSFKPKQWAFDPYLI